MNGYTKAGRPKGTYRKARLISEREFNSVIQFLEESNGIHKNRNICILLLNFHLGIKAIDLCLLKASDVFNGKEILGGLCIRKTEPIVHIRLDKKLRFALDLYVKQRIEEEGGSFDTDFILFKSQKNNFSSATLVPLIKKIYHDAGFPGVTSHSGKGAFMKKQVEMHQDIKTVGKMISDVSMNVRRYVTKYTK